MKSSGLVYKGCNLDIPNITQVAQSVGIYGERVEDPAALPAAVERFLTHEGPAILDVVTASQELVLPPTIHIEQVKGFSLWGLRAVMDGKMQHVIDLARVNLFDR